MLAAATPPRIEIRGFPPKKALKAESLESLGLKIFRDFDHVGIRIGSCYSSQ